MNTPEFSKVRRALMHALDPDFAARAAFDVGFTRRTRTIKSFELVVALIAAFGTRATKSIADVVRTFNLMAGNSVAYKPFHNQLRKAEFPQLMERITLHLIGALAQTALRPLKNNGLRCFKDIVIQDATWFAVHDELATNFPGRYTDKSPAALAVHTTLSLFRDQPVGLTLAGAAYSEQRFRPEAESLQGCLFLADRGYANTEYCRQLSDAGASFIIRFLRSANPLVQTAWVDGRRLRKAPGKKLVECIRKLRGHDGDLNVVWQRGKKTEPIECRVVLRWNPVTRQHVILATNLRRDRFSAHVVANLYRLRWQIELIFKEWKSFANLHRFATRIPALAQGLAWTAIAAAVVKRFLAYATQRVFGRVISTQRTAMMIGAPMFQLLSALMARTGVARKLATLLEFLSTQALRAHPKRDRTTGRLAPGLEHAFTAFA